MSCIGAIIMRISKLSSVIQHQDPLLACINPTDSLKAKIEEYNGLAAQVSRICVINTAYLSVSPTTLNIIDSGTANVESNINWVIN